MVILEIHKKIVRYFMTISEAVELVIQAGAMGKGGDIFVLDMGEPVKILDLAVKMIQLSGLEVIDKHNPNGDIEINLTPFSQAANIDSRCICRPTPP